MSNDIFMETPLRRFTDPEHTNMTLLNRGANYSKNRLFGASQMQNMTALN